MENNEDGNGMAVGAWEYEKNKKDWDDDRKKRDSEPSDSTHHWNRQTDGVLLFFFYIRRKYTKWGKKTQPKCEEIMSKTKKGGRLKMVDKYLLLSHFEMSDFGGEEAVHESKWYQRRWQKHFDLTTWHNKLH